MLEELDASVNAGVVYPGAATSRWATDLPAARSRAQKLEANVDAPSLQFAREIRKMPGALGTTLGVFDCSGNKNSSNEERR